VANDFLVFHDRYHQFFQVHKKSVAYQSQQYLCGLMQAVKKNMERMTEVVPDSNWQSIQNFISHSPWDSGALLDQIAIDANALIGGNADSCLIVDESGFTKKGKKSVGVSRQWNGRQGKVDNCQVAVYAALCCRNRVCLTDTRLFLPENWTNDKQRCLEAGVATDRLEHRKKSDLAFEMVQSAREKGLSFQWVGGDAFYGDDPGFLRQLDQIGEIFMLDVHKDQTIYLEDPMPYVPNRKSNRGPTPKLLQTDLVGQQVSQWAKQQPKSAWKKVFIRDSTMGILTAKVLHREVWLWDGKETYANKWQLVVTVAPNSKNKIKYSLSNAPLDTTLERLVFMQSQRYWVERAIEDGKSHAGLADYQVRGWTGWHHHMAMVMLALLFMLETKINNEDSFQLLSCYDVQDLLAHFLPRRDITKQEVLRQMLVRHRQRAVSIDYHYKNQMVDKSD
jgi:SRSO17 transposase